MQKAAGTQAVGQSTGDMSYGFLMDATLGISVGTHLVDLNLSVVELEIEIWGLSPPDGI